MSGSSRRQSSQEALDADPDLNSGYRLLLDFNPGSDAPGHPPGMPPRHQQDPQDPQQEHRRSKSTPIRWGMAAVHSLAVSGDGRTAAPGPSRSGSSRSSSGVDGKPWRNALEGRRSWTGGGERRPTRKLVKEPGTGGSARPSFSLELSDNSEWEGGAARGDRPGSLVRRGIDKLRGIYRPRRS
ncbi:hypothetical protein VTK73DRAFT_9338 [Phialemonium thermophilum]|uniref:Uncharacterized protein n=1 Tax=Phialemonium thermophilum TaxID=223376 RepID=A0ABR3XKA0_9PEZI